MTDTSGTTHVSLVTSKTRVAPLKRITIPRLELCGAHLLTQLMSHVQQVLEIPLNNVFAWTDSTVVLAWLAGDPRRFKPYVGNRVSQIVEHLPSSRWRHVGGSDNPADCASRGLFPSELLQYKLWWEGPNWLYFAPPDWPQHPAPQSPGGPEELCFTTITAEDDSTLLTHFSTLGRLKSVTAWILRFVALVLRVLAACWALSPQMNWQQQKGFGC